jgi:hypothetical protein
VKGAAMDVLMPFRLDKGTIVQFHASGPRKFHPTHASVERTRFNAADGIKFVFDISEVFGTGETLIEIKLSREDAKELAMRVLITA